jgi:hypothetical protein
MNKKAAGQSAKPGKFKKAARKNTKSRLATLEFPLPAGSRERDAAGFAAAVGSLLLVGATLGVGPAVLAGAAGYLAYRGMRGGEKQRRSRPRSRQAFTKATVLELKRR